MIKLLTPYTKEEIGNWDIVGSPLPQLLADLISKTNEIIDTVNKLKGG